MAPSDVHVQTAGAREESEMARDPGGPLRRLVRGASNGAQAASSRRPLRFERDRPDQRAGLIRSGMENRRCAAERQPVGRETAPGGLTGPPWLRSRLPRTRRTLAGAAGGAGGVAGRSDGMPRHSLGGVAPALAARAGRGRPGCVAGGGGAGALALDEVGDAASQWTEPRLDIGAHGGLLARRLGCRAQVLGLEPCLVFSEEAGGVLGIGFVDQAVLLVGARQAAVSYAPVDVGRVATREALVGLGVA